MAIPKNSSPQPTASTQSKATNYADLLRRAEQQKILAREMIKNAKQMVDSAVEMRNRPRVVLLP